MHSHHSVFAQPPKHRQAAGDLERDWARRSSDVVANAAIFAAPTGNGLTEGIRNFKFLPLNKIDRIFIHITFLSLTVCNTDLCFCCFFCGRGEGGALNGRDLNSGRYVLPVLAKVVGNRFQLYTLLPYSGNPNVFQLSTLKKEIKTKLKHLNTEKKRKEGTHRVLLH